MVENCEWCIVLSSFSFNYRERVSALSGATGWVVTDPKVFRLSLVHQIESIYFNAESYLQMNVSLEVVGSCHHHHTHVVHLNKCYHLVVVFILQSVRT